MAEREPRTACAPPSLREQPQLCAAGTAEAGGGEIVKTLGETGFATRDLEKVLDLFGENAVASHARAELGLVELAMADSADSIEDFVLLQWKMSFEPPLEKLLVGVGQS